MTDQTEPNQAMIPYLTVTDSKAAMQFYADVFGAEQVGELFEMDDDRVGHAMMKINGDLIYLADEFAEMNIVSPLTRGGSSVGIVISVEDADQTYQGALNAGAAGDRPPENAHGLRIGWFVDPWGPRWSPTSPEKPAAS